MNKLHLLLIVSFIFLLGIISPANAHESSFIPLALNELYMQDNVEGMVISEYKDDIYVIQTRKYYVIVEWLGGRFSEGDIVRGELHRYGRKEIYNIKRDCEVKVFIEEYYSVWDDVIKWLKEHKKI